MPRKRADEDVADLPQLAAQPPALGLEHRPPHEHADGDERRVLERVHERVAHGGLEEDREVPAVEHEHVDGQRHERLAQDAEAAAQPVPSAPAARARRGGGRRPAPGCAARSSISGAARSAISRCWSMWKASPSSPRSSIGLSSPTIHSAIAACQATICHTRHGDAAAVQDPQRAQVEALEQDQPDDDAPCPKCGALEDRAAQQHEPGDHDRDDRRRRSGSGTPPPRSGAGSARR